MDRGNNSLSQSVKTNFHVSTHKKRNRKRAPRIYVYKTSNQVGLNRKKDVQRQEQWPPLSFAGVGIFLTFFHSSSLNLYVSGALTAEALDLLGPLRQAFVATSGTRQWYRCRLVPEHCRLPVAIAKIYFDDVYM